jgi:DNA-binding transcriptional ArsR family regulator
MARPKRREQPRRLQVRHPLQVRILAACNQREVTAREIASKEKMPVTTVGYHFQTLEKNGYLRVARKERARGFVRHYYVADRQAVITDKEFEQMSPAERGKMSNAVLLDMLGRAGQAMKAGTLDARGDSHLSWSPMELDEEGWKELIGESTRMLERSFEIQAAASARLRKTGARPIHTTFTLAAFESPDPEPPAAE